ncbi:MAG TPA: sn-glycerol-3-phosphate ABC transporter ATP-binding protein UgpC [Thermoanaerobaculia bacterium]|nr:sn-glycerol-3-phosphate ABC transporter ATP-binding protein UgpC [Thermoanaerobaculia bacterium]
MATVAFIGVWKSFGEVPVLEDFDLEVADREFLVLVGPSGCGKSTALRLVAGLEHPTRGEVRIGGRAVNDLPPKERDIAMVFQSYALYPHMTVRQNLDFGLRMRKVPRAEIDRLVGEAARTLELDGLLDRRPRQLSGGQRQRVALGRAVVRQPSAFLFDEPLSNLDAKLRVQMRVELVRLHAQLRTTVLYVTHDQVEAMTMGQRLAVLHRGRLQQCGTPLEVYDRPANLFVAGFIGTPPMNLLPGRLARGGAAVAAAGFEVPLPAPLAAAAREAAAEEVVLGIRPQGLSEPRGGEEAGPRFAARVELAEALGHQTVVHVRSGDARLIAELPPGRLPAPGELLELAVSPAALHLFDARSERRLGP